MNEIFSKQIQEALENAQRLKMVGEAELSQELCVKTVKKVSIYHNVDLIKMFYGEQAYGRIQNAADAAKYIFIAKCIADVYDVIASLEAADSHTSPWAVADSSNSHKQLRDFFLWLKKANRKVETEDCSYFIMLLNAVKGSDPPHFKMSGWVQRLTLSEIIPMLVSGKITINNHGELR